MFSYLRPHHKRTSSNPSSPADPSHQTFESNLQLDHGHPQRHQDTGIPEQPTRPPPLLPPIARVASAESNIDNLRRKGFERDVRIQNAEVSRSNGTRPSDIQTYSSHQRPQYGGTEPRESSGNAGSTNSVTPQSSRLSTGSNQDVNLRQTFSSSTKNFVVNTDSQNKMGPTGRKPNGTRLPSTAPASTNTFSTFEPAPARSSKTRLNLLNPMSLLARRRTSQAVTQLSPDSLVSGRNRNNFSETFDPRIRGTVVHDFSAPRPPKRNVSRSDIQAGGNSVNNPRQFLNPKGDQNTDENLASPWSGGNHNPIFTENFEEEQYPAAGPHVRKATDLTDLPLPKPPYAKGAQKSIFESSLAPKSNEATREQSTATRDVSRPASDEPPPVPPKQDAQLPEARRVSIDPAPTPPKAGSNKGCSRNVSEVSARDAAIPKHMKSTSSRFSFDMIGAAEQERLLEDRHRQKALEKKAENGGVDERMEDEFADDYDYDNMDDEDGLEERIPGVNADLDEEDPYQFSDEGGNLRGFTFQQSSLGSPMSPASPGMVSTPRDANGEVIGFAMSKNSPYLSLGIAQDSVTSPTLAPSPDRKSADKFPAIHGLGLQSVDMQHGISSDKHPSQSEAEVEEFPRPAVFDDDDLYFDDGIIAGPGEDDNVEFDESVFDNIDTDKYGRPLRPILAPLPTLYSPPMLMSNASPSLGKIAENAQNEKNTSDSVSAGKITEENSIVPQSSILETTSIAQATYGLTQVTLAAYQSALAAAAFTAAANGKFRRDSTPPNLAPSEQEENHPGLVTDSSQASQYEAFSPSYELEDDFDYDDVLEDDPIIAAANAEALANDCDGFYGQEFGFYSAPAAAEAEYANGGYFGPRGVEGINRSQSARVASREPNLTPITERSEYSNRNSFMSLNMHGIASTPSPGLAQLAGMMRSPDYESDMSLDALLKLRRGAWGGSQASLHSSNGSLKSAPDDSSPIGQGAPWNQSSAIGHPGNIGDGHRSENSAFGLASESASAVDTGAVRSPPGSPIMTMSDSALDASRPDENVKSKDDKDKEAKFRKHRYNSSAESISYSKEDDPVAGERWILERRRTGEAGEIELLGREVVSGGRI